jgi:[ribosomal protein S5]-alanine N-acetyltransferase
VRAPTLRTERLTLRPLRAEDAPALHAIYADPQVAHWIGVHTLADVEAEIAQHVDTYTSLGYGLLAVEERASGALIGDCGLQPFEHRGPEPELGYDFAPAAWGRGLATEAARAVMTHAFGALALDRVIAVVKRENVASQRVLEKAGLARAGARRAYGDTPMLLYAATRPGSVGRAAAYP